MVTEPFRAKEGHDGLSSGSSGQLIRKVPWIEAIGTALASGILYFVLGKHELAEFFAVAGSLLALGRLSYTAELEKEIRELREPLDRIREHFDLLAQAHLEVFRGMLQVYGEITEDEFARVKEGILSEARAQLVYLANEKKSEILSTTKYYGWLLPMVEKAQPPQRIWALSLMRELEWDDSPPERRFIELSRQAAERGVHIDRIFIMRHDFIADAIKNEAIRLHLSSEHPKNLHGFVVEEERLIKADIDLQRRVGDGFLAFDSRVAMVDVFSDTARGYVTMNPVEIAHLREIFERLKILAEDLDSVAARNAPTLASSPPNPTRNAAGQSGTESGGSAIAAKRALEGSQERENFKNENTESNSQQNKTP